MNELNDKVVLITGAGRGTGRLVAQGVSEKGAFIAANDISPVNLDQTEANVISAGGKIKQYVHDITKKMPVQALVSDVLDDWGKIDYLINAVAVRSHASIIDMDEWDWHRTIDMNLGGPFLVLQSVSRIMREQGGGGIINVIPIENSLQGSTGLGAFTASKWGLLSLSQTAAFELRQHDIKVNAICVGKNWSRTINLLGTRTEDDEQHPAFFPQQNTKHPEDLMGLILYLMQETAPLITGQIYVAESP